MSQQQPQGNGFWDRVNDAFSKQNPEELKESCLITTAMHGTMGFAFGGLLGMFLAGMGSSSPELLHLQDPSASAAQMSAGAQVRMALKDLGSRSWSSARSFGKIATIYSAAECGIETYRAKHDIWNTVGAGSITGALISIKNGPKAMVLGAAGFAAFSTAIDHFFQDRF